VFKVCSRCSPSQMVPSRDWGAHQDAHKNLTRTRKTGWGSEFDRVKRRVLERDAYRCQSCGRTRGMLKRQGKTLHVHHVNGVAEDNSLENLACLCEDCHYDTFTGSRGRTIY
jgi:5-methylcytosine-specific restriction endonuclease McrA